jgi:hypothetical protein
MNGATPSLLEKGLKMAVFSVLPSNPLSNLLGNQTQFISLRFA